MRKLDLKRINDLIPDPVNKKVLKNSDGTTRDIIKEVLDTYAQSRNQLKQFGPMFKADTLLKTCENIWKFWKENVKYKIDPEGVQWIKTPSAFWNEGRDPFGDCKSFSIAVAASLHALDIAGAFRFVSFGNNYTNPTHVYVVVKHLGQEIIIDCVWHTFNSQKPFTKNWDYNMTAIYSISGIGATVPTTNGRGVLQVNENNILDLTQDELDLLAQKQLLEVEQMIVAKKKGIGSTHDNAYEIELMAVNNALAEIGRFRGIRNPFKFRRVIAKGPAGSPFKRVPQVNPVVLTQPEPPVDAVVEDAEVSGDGDDFSYVAGKKAKPKKEAKKAKKEAKKTSKAVKRNEQGKGIKKKDQKRLEKINVVVKKKKEGILKKIGKGLAKVATAPLKGLAQLALKVELPKNAPFFLYLFLDDPKDPVRSQKILAKLPQAVAIKRQKAQQAQKAIIEKIKMKPETFDKIIRTGIMKRYMKPPEEVLAQWMQEGNFQIGIVEDALKIAGGAIKLLLSKLGANFQEDLENYTPDPADWLPADSAANQELAQTVTQLPGNQLSVPDYTEEQLMKRYPAGDYPDRGSALDKVFDQGDVILPPGRRTRPAVDLDEEGEEPLVKGSDNTGVLLIAGVAALALMGGGSAHRKN